MTHYYNIEEWDRYRLRIRIKLEQKAQKEAQMKRQLYIRAVYTELMQIRREMREEKYLLWNELPWIKKNYLTK